MVTYQSVKACHGVLDSAPGAANEAFQTWQNGERAKILRRFSLWCGCGNMMTLGRHAWAHTRLRVQRKDRSASHSPGMYRVHGRRRRSLRGRAVVVPTMDNIKSIAIRGTRDLPKETDRCGLQKECCAVPKHCTERARIGTAVCI